MKLIWDENESNAPLDAQETAKEIIAAFFRDLREELEAEDLEEDYEDDDYEDEA
jgi:hypothetical protein